MPTLSIHYNAILKRISNENNLRRIEILFLFVAMEAEFDAILSLLVAISPVLVFIPAALVAILSLLVLMP